MHWFSIYIRLYYDVKITMFDVWADIPHIASWFAEIIPPCHRRGNKIIFAAA